MIAIPRFFIEQAEAYSSGSTYAFDVDVFSNKSITIGLAGTEANTTTQSVNTPWDASIYELTSATLYLEASQPYLSGAEMHAFMNNNDEDDLYWGAFDSSTKNTTVDITGQLVNGSNDFYVQYKIAFGSVGNQTANIVSLHLHYELTYIGSGTPTPPKPPSTPPTFQPLVIPWYIELALIGVGGLVVYGLINHYSGGKVNEIVVSRARGATTLGRTAALGLLE